MPQPKSGRITRSPFAVPRMTRMDWRTLSSYSARRNMPLFGSSRSGKPVPMPRNGFAMAALPDGHVAECHDRPLLLVAGIVAGRCVVAGACGGLLVDAHVAAAPGNRCPVLRCIDEGDSRRRRNVRS